MYTHLYSEARFTDTGIMQHYLEELQDNTNRVVSIGDFPPAARVANLLEPQLLFPARVTPLFIYTYLW